MKLITLAISIGLLISSAVTEPELMRVTCYTGGYVTATGTEPRYGICAAKPDWYGMTAVVYDKDMNFIDAFVIEDTGGHPRIQSGSSIDIWQPTLADCYDWVGTYGDYMYVQIVETE